MRTGWFKVALVCGVSMASVAGCDRGAGEAEDAAPARPSISAEGPKAADAAKEPAWAVEQMDNGGKGADPVGGAVAPVAKGGEGVDAGAEGEGAEGEQGGETPEVDAGAGGEDEAAGLKLLEATMATGVEDRMPVGAGDRFDTSADTLWAYAVIENKGEATEVKMVWKKEGVEKFAIDVKVGVGKGWRTWSRRQIVKKKDAGRWSVEIVTQGGAVLATMPFEIVAAP